MKADTRSIDSSVSFTRKSTLSAENLSCRFSRSDTVAVGMQTRCLCLLRSLRCQVMFLLTSLKSFGEPKLTIDYVFRSLIQRLSSPPADTLRTAEGVFLREILAINYSALAVSDPIETTSILHSFFEKYSLIIPSMARGASDFRLTQFIEVIIQEIIIETQISRFIFEL